MFKYETFLIKEGLWKHENTEEMWEMIEAP